MSLRAVHRAHLERQRHAMNLVGPGDVSVHYDDCERALQWLTPQGLWADLGSGAGFPGVILADLFPSLQVHLVESRRKRSVFLEQVLLQAGVEPSRVRVLHQRVESLPAASYDGIVARAFAPVPRVIEVATRLLVPGGVLVLFMQDGATIDVPDSFEVFHVERYRLGERMRSATALVLRN